MGKEKPYPWMKIGHRLREVPGVIVAFFHKDTRRRLGKIVKRREELRSKLGG